MTTLSLAMIVKDEAVTLARVLADAAAVCDELVVVDTGSVDGTVDIALAAGARVEQFPWVDDFAAARNASFAACTSDWVLWLDADDRLTPEVQARLTAYKESLLSDDLDAVYVPYRYAYSEDGQSCVLQLPRERLLRRAAGLRWDGAVHEVISVPDPSRAITLTDVWVEHRPEKEVRATRTGRNLRILERVVSGGDRSLRTLLYHGNELAANNRHEEAIAAWAEYVDGAPVGWERTEALLSMARSMRALGRIDDLETTVHRLLRAAPERAEPWVLGGLHHFDAGRWAEAVPYFLAATGCMAPAEGFVVVNDYGYVPWDFLAVCWHNLGDQRRALEALGKSVDGNPERERLIDNAGWILKKW